MRLSEKGHLAAAPDALAPAACIRKEYTVFHSLSVDISASNGSRFAENCTRVHSGKT